MLENLSGEMRLFQIIGDPIIDHAAVYYDLIRNQPIIIRDIRQSRSRGGGSGIATKRDRTVRVRRVGDEVLAGAHIFDNLIEGRGEACKIGSKGQIKARHSGTRRGTGPSRPGDGSVGMPRRLGSRVHHGGTVG